MKMITKEAGREEKISDERKMAKELKNCFRRVFTRLKSPYPNNQVPTQKQKDYIKKCEEKNRNIIMQQI